MSFINLNKIEYKMSATGKLLSATYNQNEKIITDYKLYIEASNLNKTLIGSASDFDESLFSLLWAGDINNDGCIDVIMDLARKYSYQEIVLFVSEKIGNKYILKEYARFRIYAC